MMNPAKRIILEGLNRAGYRLLKREEYERFVTASGAQQAAQAVHSGVLPSPASVSASLSASSLEVVEFAPGMAGANLASFLDRVKGMRDLSPLRAGALYSIADYIARAGVKGEVVDCGYGRMATLVALAAAFVQNVCPAVGLQRLQFGDHRGDSAIQRRASSPRTKLSACS
jgi:hypothetical protein